MANFAKAFRNLIRLRRRKLKKKEEEHEEIYGAQNKHTRLV